MTKILIVLIFILSLTSCNTKHSDNNKSKVIIQNLYIETQNFPDDTKSCIESKFENRIDTSWVINDTVYMYHYRNADLLPNSNLLDNTKKIRISILDEKDSIGNPIFSVEVFRTEQSKWRQTSNSSRNLMYSDTLLSKQEICNQIVNSTNIYILKFNP